MTLREICDAIKVTRRAVQGYEKIGLVSASGRSDRGYLLYDERAFERIKQIRMFQDLGFTLKQIKEIIDMPNEQLKPIIEAQLEKRREEVDCLELLTRKICETEENSSRVSNYKEKFGIPLE